MHNNVMLHRLKILVDPLDVNCKPSLVIVSAGPSAHSLREMRAIHISTTDSLVTLLSDVRDVSISNAVYFYPNI